MDFEERLLDKKHLVSNARTASQLALIAASVTGIMTVVAMVDANWPQALVEGASLAICLIAYTFLRRDSYTQSWSLALLLVVFANNAYSAWLGENFETVTLAWLAILVLAAYAIAGKVVGLTTGVLSLAFIIGSFGGLLEVDLYLGERLTQTAIELSLMVVACLGIIWLFEVEKEAEIAHEKLIVERLRESNTELETAIEEIQSLQARLVEAERHGSLQRLAGHFAHDFNNLLTGIMAEVDFARMDSKEPDVREGLDNALESARKAADLTRSMLTYSGRRATRFTTAKANEIVQDVTTLARLGTRYGVDFEVPEIGDDVHFEGDASQVEQALLNLVLNGVQASDEQKPRITIEAVCRQLDLPVVGAGGTRCEAGEVVELRVRDYGRGIPEKVREQVFEPYFTTREEGQGLGLSSVVGIIRAHSGAISVHPAQPGSLFTLFLPQFAQDRNRSLTREVS